MRNKCFTVCLARILATSILFFSQTVLAEVTKVTASVDKNPAMADESITLTIKATGSAGRDAFDPSPLLSDFIVGRTSVSTQTSIVNFDTTRTTQWSTLLVPRKPGRYRIPAFEVEGLKTEPIELLVVPVAAGTSGQQRDLFITADVDMPTVYLQQQIKYTVKLHIAQDLQRGSLEAPTLENADIRQVGKDAEYSDIIDGRRFRVIERVFAIIPQTSGTFTINGPLFEGEVIDNSRQSFGFFNRTKTVRRVGPSVDIEVLPIPSDYDAHWLPSEFVQLNEEWQSAAGEYRVGEPITRTLTLVAAGLVEEQLPDIGSQYPASVKVYPDQASTATVERNNTLVAQRVESHALIPNQAGEIRLPEVRVPWFNIVTRETQFATLPARTLNVLPAVATANPLTPDTQATAPLSNTDKPVAITPTTLPAVTHWWSVSSWVLLFLWLATLLLWFFRRPSTNHKQKASTDLPEAKYWNEVQRAIKKGESKEILAALQPWLGVLTGDAQRPLTSSQRKIASDTLDSMIADLYADVYGSDSQQWTADNLNQQLARIRQQHQPNRNDDVSLKHLYPTT